MAGSFTDSFENSVLNYIFNDVALPTGSFEIGLFTVAPTDSSPGTEVISSGTAYARQPVTSWTTSTSGLVSNTSDINFPTATGAGWGTIVAIGVFKGTTLIAYAEVTGKQITAGDTVKIMAGDLDITLD